MKQKGSLRFILKCLYAFKAWFALQAIVWLLWAVDLSLRPYLIKIILDKLPRVTPENAMAGLAWPAGIYLFMTFLSVVNFRVYDFICLNLNSALKKFVGEELIKQTLNHSQSFFQSNFSGNLGNKIKEAIVGIPELIRVFIDRFFSNFLAVLIAIGTVWTVNYNFAILLSLWAFCFIGATLKFSQYARLLSQASAQLRSKVVGQIVDMIGNMTSVSLFASKSFELKKMISSLDAYVSADRRRDWYLLKVFSFKGISFVFYQAICLVFLIKGLESKSVTPGDFALILSINISLVESLWALSRDIRSFSDLAGNISQSLDLLLSPLEITDAPGAKVFQFKRGEIVFDKVNFKYKDGADLFHQMSVKIYPGQKVGLVGYSGSGKTTFINLILRLYDLEAGQILIDGQNIREVTQESLRSTIGVIPQDPSLFHRSIMENIRYGDLRADEVHVKKAAEQAYAHDFICELSGGYDTFIGDKGVKLSGGQRQRIAIARAILKNAPIIILDEATSQMDSLTEQYIQNSIWNLMQGKTALIVAHRLSTLVNMDRILVFDQGAIVEDGSHLELIERDGLYTSLWRAHQGGICPNQANKGI